MTDANNDSQYSIKRTMMEENNNCVFLSKYIKNVAVRWNKDIDILQFRSSWDKREVQNPLASDEVMAEVIVQQVEEETETVEYLPSDCSANSLDSDYEEKFEKLKKTKETTKTVTNYYKIKISKADLKKKIQKFGAEIFTAQEYPVIGFKERNQMNNGLVINLTFGALNEDSFPKV